MSQLEITEDEDVDEVFDTIDQQGGQILRQEGPQMAMNERGRSISQLPPGRSEGELDAFLHLPSLDQGMPADTSGGIVPKKEKKHKKHKHKDKEVQEE